MTATVKMDLIVLTRKDLDALHTRIMNLKKIPKMYTATVNECLANVKHMQKLIMQYEFDFITAEEPTEEQTKRLINVGRIARRAVINPTLVILKTLGL